MSIASPPSRSRSFAAACGAVLRRAACGLVATAVIAGGLGFAGPASAQSGIRDAEIETMLEDWSEPIFRAAGLTPSSVDLYLLNDPALNAFVSSGQKMFFFTGLLLAVDTPNQLKGVIAHETGHIAGGHLARSGEAIRAATRPMIITMGLGLLAAAAGAPDAGAALLLGSQTVAERSLLAYSRAQESAADQAAASYLEATGQSARGLEQFMDKFRDLEVLSQRSQDPYIRSHPLSQERIAALQNRVSQSPYSDVEDSAADKQRLERVQAKLYGFLERPEATLRRFPESDLSIEARYARAVAYFRRPDIDKAIAEVDALILAEPANPYFHELKGQIYFESGQAAAAVGPHRESVELAPDQPLLHVNLAQALIAQPAADQDPEINLEAKRHLETALRAEPDNSFAWHQLAIVEGRLGDEAMASLATAERFFVLRDYAQAAQFAERARRGLPRGSPSANRAADILQVAKVRGVRKIEDR